MKKLCSLIIVALSGCTTIPNSSLDYDWHYSSEVEENFDKFEGESTISISAVDISSSTGAFGQQLNPARISFHYHYKNSLKPTFAYFTIAKDSSIPQLETADFKFETNGKFHQGEMLSYRKHPRQVGNASISTYSGSYNESTRFVEVASFKFKVSDLCPFNKQSSFEFKAGDIYMLSQGYSVSLEKWCARVTAALNKQNEAPSGSRP